MIPANAIHFAPRESTEEIESGLHFAPKFDANGLLTAVVVDHDTGDVLMVAHMNEESLRKTLELGEAVYWSRSRKQLWHKGKTSGHIQKVREIRVDCDQDAIVLAIEQVGPGCCHTGFRSCFSRRLPHADERAATAPGQPLSLIRTSSPAFDPAQVYGA